MPREIWLNLNGKRETVGYLEQRLNYRSRVLRCEPRRALDGNGSLFTLFEKLIRGHGYSPIISESGVVTLTLPINDSYGWIIRELAKTYWTALQLPVETQPEIPKEAAQ